MDEAHFITELKKLVGKTLHTLDRQKPFTIDEIKSTSIKIITSTGNPRSIDFRMIVSAYNHLIKNGELTRIQIRDHYSDFHPAYIAAILANLPNVKWRLKPITLLLCNKT